MRLFAYAVLPLFLLGAKGPLAETNDGSEEHPQLLSDSIVVSANRTATPIREIASSVSVITFDQIRESRVSQVSELLREVPGLDVVRSGGAGQQTSVFIRGSNSNHTLVIIDGVEMNDPSTPNGAFDFSHLSTENIERIEILRGPQSVLYGSDAIGGVIQITTKKGYEGNTIRVSSQAGSFDSYRQNFEIEGVATNLSYGLGFLREDTHGISATSRSVNSTEKDGYGNTGVTGRVSASPTNTLNLSLSGRYTDADIDIDQSAQIHDDPNNTLVSKELALATTATYADPSGNWKQSLGGYVQNVKREGRDGLDAYHPLTRSNGQFDGRRFKFDLQHSRQLIDNLKLTAGAEVEREEFSQVFSSDSPFGPFSNSVPWVETTTRSVFGLAQLDYHDRLYITLGARHDDHQQFGVAATYRTTIAFLPGNTGTKLKATYGTGFNAPSLSELFSQSFGNPDLEPEVSYGWELGLEQNLDQGRVRLGATVFWNRITDLVATDPMTFKQINLDVAESRGVEAFFQFVADDFVFSGGYTLSRARQRVGDKKETMIRRPDVKVSGTFEGNLTPNTHFVLTTRFVGEREDDVFRAFTSERVTLDSYYIVDLTASYDVTGNLRVFGRVENLFDEDYVEVVTFGTRPLSAFVGLEFSLAGF